jgi:hypothetical protein
MGDFIHDIYRNIKRFFFIGYLKLCTPTLFTEESSSLTSSEILARTKSFPSMNCFICIYCLGMETMSRRVAFALMLAN